MSNNLSKIQIDNIRTNPIGKLMWSLSLPSIVAMVLWGMNTLTDAIFVGQMLGADALSGVAMSIPFTAITLGLGQWIGGGAANVLSNAIGAGDKTTQKKILPLVLLLSLLAALLVTLPVYYFAANLMELMGAKGNILHNGLRYFKTTTLASFFWIFGMSMNLLIRGEGRIKQSARMIVLGLLVNILLTPILIHYGKMGTEGAAWAINIGMLVLCGVQLRYFLSGKASFSVSSKFTKWDNASAKTIIQTGLPGFLFSIMSLVQSLLMFNVLADYGSPKDIAVFAAISTINSFLLTPLYGLMQAFQPVAGINYGAGQYERIKTALWTFSKNGTLLLLPFWLLVILFSQEVLELIVKDYSIASKDLGYFRMTLSVLPLMPFMLVSLNLFPAVKKSAMASLVVLLRQLLLFVPAMLLLPHLWGVEAIYLGNLFINVLALLLTAFFVYITLKSFNKNVEQKYSSI